MACVTACPSGRAVRQAHRGHPRPGRAPARATRRATGRCGAPIFALFPHPRRLRRAARPAARPTSATGLERLVRRSRPARPDRPAAGGDGEPGAARCAKRGDRCPSGCPPRTAPRGGRACSPAACRASSSPASTPPPRGCWPAEGCDVVDPAATRAAAGRCRCTTAARPEAQDYARALVDAFDGAGRRADRRERRRLRLDDEGVRRPARRRPAVRRAGPRVRGEGARHLRGARRARTGRHRGTRSRPPSPTTTRATSGTPRGCAASRARCSRAIPGVAAARDRRGRGLLRLGRDLQHPQPRAGPRARATARPPTSSPPGADLLVTANPGCLMQVASAIERSGHPMRLVHTVELLDASLRGAGLPDPPTKGV